MTRRTNARIAGFAFLLYIGVAFPGALLLGRATHGEGIAAQLATMARHTGDVHLAVVLSLAGSISALVLAVTLHAITREQDPDLAMLGLVCRAAEGVAGAVSLPWTLGLLWLATATGADAPDPAAARALAAFLLRDTPLVPSILFAVGSTCFSWLILRGRMVPAPLAWLGVVASVLLVAGLPLQLAGLLQGPVTQLMWLPMAAYEIPLGLWLIIKGAAAPA